MKTIDGYLNELYNRIDEIVEDKLRQDNPALMEAWQQIKAVRAAGTIDKELLERRHWTVASSGIVVDNAELRTAWERYDLIRALII